MSQPPLDPSTAAPSSESAAVSELPEPDVSVAVDEPAAAEAVVPAPVAKPKRRCLLRRVLLLEAVQRAKAEQLQPGAPGWREFALARAAREAAEVVGAPRQGLRDSDGSAAALLLAQEATRWALAAHLVRRAMPVPEQPHELWDSAIGTTALKTDTLELARVAFVERDFETSSELASNVRHAEVRALRETLDRLLAPLESSAARLGRIRLLQLALVLGVLGVLAGAIAGGVYGWKIYERGVNVARGAKVQTSALKDKKATADAVVDGDIKKLAFETRNQNQPWIMLDLGAPKNIHEVWVHNRRDCCRDAAVPLVIDVSLDNKVFQQVAKRDKPFKTWAASFPLIQARYVRLKTLKTSTLHLNEVEVYAAR